jgi:hypothetical protein
MLKLDAFEEKLVELLDRSDVPAFTRERFGAGKTAACQVGPTSRRVH